MGISVFNRDLSAQETQKQKAPHQLVDVRSDFAQRLPSPSFMSGTGITAAQTLHLLTESAAGSGDAVVPGLSATRQ